jgi:hypothetical protein
VGREDFGHITFHQAVALECQVRVVNLPVIDQGIVALGIVSVDTITVDLVGFERTAGKDVLQGITGVGCADDVYADAA